MRIAFFGDVVGKPGRRAITEFVPTFRAEREVDLVIVNVENSAHGYGITPQIIEELTEAGVDVFSGGNHSWKNKYGVEFLESNPERVVCPGNYDMELPGRGWTRIEVNGTPVVLMNMVGQVFMNGPEVTSPAEYFDEVYAENKDAVVIVDFHAEVTGEKRALGWYLKDRASVLVGTHTHIGTVDHQILRDPEDAADKPGTAYVTDIGMSGATYSSLGMDVEQVVDKVIRGVSVNLEPPVDPKRVRAAGVLVEIDEETKMATSIERIDHEMDIPYTKVS